MKNVVEIEINVPQARLAELFSDPGNSTKWMDDLARYEPVSGTPGTPSTRCLAFSHGVPSGTRTAGT